MKATEFLRKRESIIFFRDVVSDLHGNHFRIRIRLSFTDPISIQKPNRSSVEFA